MAILFLQMDCMDCFMGSLIIAMVGRKKILFPVGQPNGQSLVVLELIAHPKLLSMKKRKLKKHLEFYPIFILIIGFLALVYSLTYIPYIQTHTPVGRYQKAYAVYKYAKTFPIGSNEYMKFMSIASALFHNQQSFSLGSSGQVPIMPPQPPAISSTP